MRENGYHHGNLPAALKQAVLDIVAEADISAVTMAEVARRTGVSPGAPYKHFDGLDDLVLATAVDANERFTARMQAMLAAHADADAETRLTALIRDYFVFAEEDSGSFRLMFDSRLGRRSRALDPWSQASYEMVLGLVSDATGLRPDGCRELALNVSAVVAGHARLHLDRFSPVSTLAEAPDLAVRGVQMLFAAARLDRTKARKRSTA